MWGSQEAPAAGRGSARKIQIEVRVISPFPAIGASWEPHIESLLLLSIQVCHLDIPVRCVVCAQKIPLSLPFSYVSVSHDFHPQEAAAAACRPHIMLSTFCDLQLLCAEHPHPLQASGAPRPLIPHAG